LTFLFCSNYTLGQLIYRVIQFNETQTRRPEDNHINFWKSFVHEFFTDNAIFKYSILVEKDLKPFVVPVRLLPRYFKSLYADNLRTVSYILDEPREFSTDTNMYFLDCPRARIISVFDDAQVCTIGSLRIMFTVNLKIHLWEFDAHKHIEYYARPAMEEKVASFIRTISAMSIPTHNEKNNGTANHHHHDDEKVVIKREPRECNGNSPNHANGDYDGPSENEANGNSTNDVVNQICTGLQNTLGSASPVNEYGVTPQVMRCFEISEIFLSMEDLMDYCLQFGYNPKSALSYYVSSHVTFEQ